MTIELSLQSALESLQKTTEDFLNASQGLGLLNSRKDLYDSKNALALESRGFILQPTLSLEKNQERQRSLIERLKEAVIRAYRYVRSLVIDLVNGYDTKLNRLHDSLVVIENKIRDRGQAGELKTGVRGFITDLSLGRGLFTKPDTTFQSAQKTLGYLQVLLKETRDLYNDRLKNNENLIERSKNFNSVNDLASNVVASSMSDFLRNSSTPFIDSQLKGMKRISVSDPLPGNRSLVLYIGHLKDGAKSTVPWYDYEYGMKFVDTFDIDPSDRHRYRLPVLSGPELGPLSLSIRGLIPHMRSMVDTVKRADRSLENIELDIRRLKVENQQPAVRDALFSFISASVKNDARVVTESMNMCFRYLFFSVQWLSRSLTYY